MLLWLEPPRALQLMYRVIGAALVCVSLTAFGPRTQKQKQEQIRGSSPVQRNRVRLGQRAGWLGRALRVQEPRYAWAWRQASWT